MTYASVTVEGGLFPSDLLDKIASGDVEGQKPADFRLEGGRLADEIQSAFSDARAFWDVFQRRLQTSKESPTTLTRESWIGPLLDRLGFTLEFQRSSADIGGQLYFVSHRAGDDPDAPPVHVVSIEQELDRRDGTGRRSPHALVQELLNRSDALWGIATNGNRLRLLRDSARLSKPTYLEFDLEGMIAGNLYSEFVLLYRLLHASRFPHDGASAHECLLEKYHSQGIEQGGRVRDKLRDGVEESLRVLGSAFLKHPDSAALRDKLASGQLDAPRYYRQLLRLVYRFLFLMVAEERRLVFPPDEVGTQRQNIYSKYYSISRLRDRAERYFAGDAHGDLWLALRETFALFRDDDNARKLGLSALNGELFGPNACADLERAACENKDLLSAIRCLSTFLDEEGEGRRRRLGVRRRVNYAALDVEEFGSVYESLLDFHPQIDTENWTFDLVTGSERKQTGSYYTPPELVHELIQSALVPVIEERLVAAKTTDDKERDLLLLRVCDPAAGSGHFLLAAARRIARELAKVRSGEDEPAPEEYRHALRDVIRNCIYAVDKNPLAVDLCKVALWIEGHNAGLPLSFLDAHVRHGDSLVGVFDLKVLEHGIPDDAYKAVTGDDKPTATAVRKRNKLEREGQTAFSADGASKVERNDLASEFSKLAAIDERTPDDVHAKEELYERLRSRGSEWWKTKVACDLWAYAFFAPITSERWQVEGRVPTTNVVRKQLGLLSDDVREDAKAEAVQFAQAHPFFHWPLEFPDVFAVGGFDAVLGNPPFGNAIESKTGRGEKESHFYAASYRGLAEGAYDRANIFFGRTIQTLKAGGALGLICPRATASSKGSRSLRDLMYAEAPPQMLWCPDNPRLFGGASVFVCLVAAVRHRRPDKIRVSTSGNLTDVIFGERPLPHQADGTWWELIHSGSENDQIVFGETTSLGEVADMWAGCSTGTAYELNGHVVDSPDGSGPRLVTTGAIDRYKCRWGAMTIRYLKSDYLHPRWPDDDAPPSVARARDRQRKPKILVGGLTKVIEALLDDVGDLSGVVSTHVVVPIADDRSARLRLIAVLNSAIFSYLYLDRFGAKQMSGGNCTIGKSELLSIPVPADISHAFLSEANSAAREDLWERVERFADQLANDPEGDHWAQIDGELHALVSKLYGLSDVEHDKVIAWWQNRSLRNARAYSVEP
jgi:hypothetical protein